MQSVRGHRHLTIKVETQVTFTSDYCWQEVRTLPEELWSLSVVSFNYFSQTELSLFAAASELLLQCRWRCAGRGAEVLQQRQELVCCMCESLPSKVLSVLYDETLSLTHSFLLIIRFKKLFVLGKLCQFNTSACVSRYWGALLHMWKKLHTAFSQKCSRRKITAS